MSGQRDENRPDIEIVDLERGLAMLRDGNQSVAELRKYAKTIGHRLSATRKADMRKELIVALEGRLEAARDVANEIGDELGRASAANAGAVMGQGTGVGAETNTLVLLQQLMAKVSGMHADMLETKAKVLALESAREEENAANHEIGTRDNGATMTSRRVRDVRDEDQAEEKGLSRESDAAMAAAGTSATGSAELTAETREVIGVVGEAVRSNQKVNFDFKYDGQTDLMQWLAAFELHKATHHMSDSLARSLILAKLLKGKARTHLTMVAESLPTYQGLIKEMVARYADARNIKAKEMKVRQAKQRNTESALKFTQYFCDLVADRNRYMRMLTRHGVVVDGAWAEPMMPATAMKLLLLAYNQYTVRYLEERGLSWRDPQEALVYFRSHPSACEGRKRAGDLHVVDVATDGDSSKKNDGRRGGGRRGGRGRGRRGRGGRGRGRGGATRGGSRPAETAEEAAARRERNERYWADKRCYNCNKLGHSSRKCPARVKDEARLAEDAISVEDGGAVGEYFVVEPHHYHCNMMRLSDSRGHCSITLT